MLRGKTCITNRTLQWMLRKPSLTFQLPYTQLNKRLPCPKPHSPGRSEPWSHAVMCVCVMCMCACVCVTTLSGFLFSFHLLKWKYYIMTVVYYLWWFHGPGRRPRDLGCTIRGRPPWVLALQLQSLECECVYVCGGCFLSGVLSFVLHFSVIFSAAEIPRGQNQEQNHWAGDPVVLHITALGHHGI